MPLIVNGVCRYVIIGSFVGTETATIVDVQIDTTGTSTDRANAIDDEATVIVNSWVSRLLVHQVDQWAMQTIRWVDLDSLTGSVGEKAAAHAGTNTSPPMPGNIAALVTKRVGSSRNTRQGRMFFPGIPEDYTSDADPQHLTSAVVTAMGANMELFRNDIDGTFGGVLSGGYDAHPCVVHNPPSGTSFDPIDELVVTGRLGQQRRRRGY